MGGVVGAGFEGRASLAWTGIRVGPNTVPGSARTVDDFKTHIAYERGKRARGNGFRMTTVFGQSSTTTAGGGSGGGGGRGGVGHNKELLINGH